jgi:phosphoribosyl 1,2-cyclic phosphodiesterase
LKVCLLGSGSKGNGMLVRSQETTLLIDCGFTLKETIKRLERIGVNPLEINAILVTHEHGDHIAGVGSLSRKYKIPVWMSDGTYRQSKVGTLTELNLFQDYSDFQINHISVSPYPVPHDSAQPTQYVFSNATHRWGLITDAGMVTPHIIDSLRLCDGLILEFNHDWDMLQNGPYPYKLKRRVGSDYGHLNNQQSALLLEEVKHENLKQVVAAHISEKNNCKTIVSQILERTLCGLGTKFQVAEQGSETDWICLN